MVHPLYSGPRFQGSGTNVTLGNKKCYGVSKTPLELPNRSRIIRGVVGASNANGTVLRRSAQLLLIAENDHFAGNVGSRIRREVAGSAYYDHLDVYNTE